MRRFAVWLVSCVSLLAIASGLTRADEGAPRAEYVEPVELLPGLASQPWDAGFSPGGRWFAIVNGYGSRCTILEVSSRRVAWQSPAERRSWTHRGTFTADERRFVTLAEDHVLVLDHDGTGWKETVRVPLGFETGLGALARAPLPVSLSAEGKEAAFVEDGRVWRVDIGAKTIHEVPSTKPDAFHVFFVGGDALAVGHVGAFETRVHPKAGETKVVPGVLVRPSPRGDLWLVGSDRDRFDTAYRQEQRAYRMALEIRRATTGERVSGFLLEAGGKSGGGHAHRLLMSARFSGDEKRLVVTLGTGMIEVRDVSTGGVVQTIDLFRGYAMDADLSPDRSLLVTGGRRQDGPSILVWRLAAGDLARDVEPAEARPPYELVGPFHPGFASIPWHVAVSPDGRWVAFVGGHRKNVIAVHDARTRELRWTTEPVGQPASHRPVFTKDGERLILVEGDALVVRAYGGGTWSPVHRVALGFTPGIYRDSRPIVLAPDERAVLLCHGDRAYRVLLTPSESKVEDLGFVEVAAANYVADTVAVARWSETTAETVLLATKTVPQKTLPFALLTASPDQRTWLVRAGIQGTASGPPAFRLVDAKSHEVLGDVSVAGSDEGNPPSLTMASFSPDGAHLAMVEGMRRGSIREARTGKLVQLLLEYEGDRMIGLAFGADGQNLITGGRRAEVEARNEAILSWKRRKTEAPQTGR